MLALPDRVAEGTLTATTEAIAQSRHHILFWELVKNAFHRSEAEPPRPKT